MLLYKFLSLYFETWILPWRMSLLVSSTVPIFFSAVVTPKYEKNLIIMIYPVLLYAWCHSLTTKTYFNRRANHNCISYRKEFVKWKMSKYRHHLISFKLLHFFSLHEMALFDKVFLPSLSPTGRSPHGSVEVNRCGATSQFISYLTY